MIREMIQYNKDTRPTFYELDELIHENMHRAVPKPEQRNNIGIHGHAPIITT
jgi:ubiquinone biosynthesis protein COQ9